MPKKWVRDARRKAREDAYRAVSAETHAARREVKRAERAPLPVYKAGPIRWRDAATLAGFFRSLLVWADEARGFVLYNEFESSAVPTPHSLGAVSALRLAVTDWVVRATRVRLCMKHQDAFFINGEFRSRLSYVVTTRITFVGNTSLDTEHEIRILDPKSARQYGDLVAIVSGTIIPIDAKTQVPVPIPSAPKEFLLQHVLVPSDIPRDVNPCDTVGTSNLATGIHPTTVRKSDCDAFAHLNNCTAIDLFTDAVSEGMLRDTVYFSLEFPASLKAGDTCQLNWSKWTEPKDDREHWFWLGDLSPKNGSGARALKGAFTSYWPIEPPSPEIDEMLPQPFSPDVEDMEETEENGSDSMAISAKF